MIHRKYRPSLLYKDNPISEEYFIDDGNLNKSQVNSGEKVNEPERRTQTSQPNSEALIQFPYIAKSKPNEITVTPHKLSNNSFDTKNEFSLQIHRVVIRHKILQKKKLPMIIHKKSSLKPQKSSSGEGKLSVLKSKTEVKDKHSLNSRSGKIENGGTSCKDNSSSEVKCEKQIEYKLSARQDINFYKRSPLPYNRSLKKEMLPQAALLSEPMMKQKKRRRKKRVSPIKKEKVQEAVVTVPKPRPVFVSPEFYFVVYSSYY
jgi:hypothetical protein